jgi:hypothetical protein
MEATHAQTAASGASSSFDPFDSANSLVAEDFYAGSNYAAGANGGPPTSGWTRPGAWPAELPRSMELPITPALSPRQPGTTLGRGMSLHYAYGASFNSIVAASQVFEMHAAIRFASTMTGQRKLTGDTNWQFVCDDSSVTITDSGGVPAADTWCTIRIYSTSASTIKFRIYSGVTALGSEVTISTSVPAVALAPALIHTGDGTNRVLHLDRFAVKITGTTR